MFVGFIAVVVILLVIVGLMATGATSGSGGVDQTKATKAISEISALAQSTGFYKTISPNSNYADISVDALVSAGIVSVPDTMVAPANLIVTDTAIVAGTTNVIKSKAVDGLYYSVTPAGNSGFFKVEIARDDSKVNETLAAALEKTYSKLEFNPGANIDADLATGAATTGIESSNLVTATNGTNTDGAATIYFN